MFLCRNRGEVDFFCRMNANDGSVDVWAVDGVSHSDLVESLEGFVYLPRPIPPANLTLLARMRLPDPPAGDHSVTSAYQSSLTITLDDGRVLRDTEAHDWARRTSAPSE